MTCMDFIDLFVDPRDKEFQIHKVI